MYSKKWLVGVSSLLILPLTAAGTVGTVQASIPDEGTGESEYQEEEQNIENVIVLIGDGLAAGQLEVSRALEYGKEDLFHMEQLPNVGLMQTYSNDNHVTDSAAAGSAMATSQKTDNGMVSMTPDGESHETILEAFQEQGKMTGVVVNNSVTDATPAAYTAHTDSRDNHEDIARQQFDSQYDILFGGGLENFLPEAQEGEDLTERFQEEGYEFVQTREELMNAPVTDKMLGLFADGNMALEADIDQMEEEDQPSLSEMSDVALQAMEQDEDGFFLMIEGSRIDHAAHFASANGVHQEVVEFDRTVELVQEWASERDDTLVVVTSDHETMGMSMTEVMDVEAWQEMPATSEYMVEQFEMDEESGMYTEASMRSAYEEYANMELTDEDIERLQNSLYEEDGEPIDAFYQAVEAGLIIAEHYHLDVYSQNITQLSESTSGHSGNMVPIFADGPGSDSFNGVFDNTDLSKIIAEEAGIPFEGSR
ncbi:alkaline phosphatase [Sinobaca sp. H24]|uniref:alkaline phosphatase n=1 Tax=Sinobaca sp. H24 TaxID=2923376 RepID=UPI0020797920|nr:alkaline phosphatase [Sinobaca sp. H24]